MRFIIHPGAVYSQNDGQRHIIGVGRLIELYRLPPRMCVEYGRHMPDRGGDVHLEPRWDGDYSLPWGDRYVESKHGQGPSRDD